MRTPPLFRLAALSTLILHALPAAAQNPTLSDDFDKIIGWLTEQTAQSLGFNAGSTFDPPNEMRPWRMQPDVSFGIGVMPFDKSVFPRLNVSALEERDPKGSLPDDVKFPNLTFHMRLGLPGRMDIGLRGVNMTIPKGYRLSEQTTGDGQSNSLGVSFRKHFLGGRRPMVSVGASFQRTFGFFNFKNSYDSVELTPGFIASSTNRGQLEWEIQSIGVNTVVSQVYGKWTPFLGFGFNFTDGKVDGRLEGVWDTSLIKPALGNATYSPESTNSRVLFGFQRDGSFFHYFLNGEVKASGFQAGKAFIISTGFAAPFNIGVNSSIARNRRENSRKESFRREDRRIDVPDDLRYALGPSKPRLRRGSHRATRVDSYWLWSEEEAAGSSESFEPAAPIFLR